jgi:hypothetical protein
MVEIPSPELYPGEGGERERASEPRSTGEPPHPLTGGVKQNRPRPLLGSGGE